MKKQFCLKSWLIGFYLGVCGKPLLMLGSRKEPVAYLYGGIRLPKLPEWDTTKYPFAYLFPYGTSYRLRLFSSRMYYDQYTTSSGTTDTAAAFKVSGSVIAYTITNGAWVLATTSPRPVAAYNIDDPAGTRYSRMYYVWANEDILDYRDNSVKLEAAEPVPVYV